MTNKERIAELLNNMTLTYEDIEYLRDYAYLVEKSLDKNGVFIEDHTYFKVPDLIRKELSWANDHVVKSYGKPSGCILLHHKEKDAIKKSRVITFDENFEIKSKVVNPEICVVKTYEELLDVIYGEDGFVKSIEEVAEKEKPFFNSFVIRIIEVVKTEERLSVAAHIVREKKYDKIIDDIRKGR